MFVGRRPARPVEDADDDEDEAEDQGVAPDEHRSCLLLQEVQRGEQGDPDDVDEVPVRADRLDGDVVLGRELAGHAAQQDDRDADDAAKDVRAVEAGHREEERAIDAAVDAEAVLGDERQSSRTPAATGR